MSTVIEIRACKNCGCLLNPRCGACQKNRKRLPRELYVYSVPPSHAKAPCGCLLLSCQGPGCINKFWRAPLESRKYKSNFCSLACAARAAAKATSKRETVTCDNPLCDRGDAGKRKIFQVRQFRLRNRKNVFCCPACGYIYRKLPESERSAPCRQEEEVDLDLQMLSCEGKHRGQPTEHARISGNLYKCTELVLGKPCEAVRKTTMVYG